MRIEERLPAVLRVRRSFERVVHRDPMPLLRVGEPVGDLGQTTVLVEYKVVQIWRYEMLPGDVEVW